MTFSQSDYTAKIETSQFINNDQPEGVCKFIERASPRNNEKVPLLLRRIFYSRRPSPSKLATFWYHLRRLFFLFTS